MKLPRNPEQEPCQKPPSAAREGGIDPGQLPAIDVAIVALRRVRSDISPGSGSISKLEILACRRPAQALLGGLWELPGGKIEPGEDPAAAAQREVREETGLDIAAPELLGVIEHHDPTARREARVRLHLFTARIDGSLEPKPLAGDACRWIPLDALDECAWPPANRKVNEILVRALRGR